MSNIPEYPNPSAQMIAEGNCQGRCETCEGKKICWKDDFLSEKENYEKIIEEMGNDLSEALIGNAGVTYDGMDISAVANIEYDLREIAKNLILWGWHKLEKQATAKVRKETAKEIISILDAEKGLRPNVVTDYQYRIDNIIKFIKKEFRLEVNE